jgi:uncharacterized protein
VVRAQPPPEAVAEAQAREPEPLAGDEPPSGCAAMGSRAAQMVCGDRRLAAADQRMRRAYAAALRAGVPEGDLAADQDDWRRIREDAARYSRTAVGNIYRQRIEELEAMARGGPPE